MITVSAELAVPVLEGRGFTEDQAVKELNEARVKGTHRAASETALVRITHNAGKFSIVRL